MNPSIKFQAYEKKIQIRLHISIDSNSVMNRDGPLVDINQYIHAVFNIHVNIPHPV